MASRYSAMASSSFPWLQDVAEVGVGLGVVGLEPDRLAVLGDGLVELPLARRAMPRLMMDTRAVRPQRDGHREAVDGLRDLRRSGIQVGHPEVVVEPEVGRVLAEDRLEQREAPRRVEPRQGLEDVAEPRAELPPVLLASRRAAQAGRVAAGDRVADGGPSRVGLGRPGDRLQA